MKQYLDLLADVKANGRFRPDRTGVGAYGVFGRQIRCDLSQGFPLLTTKKLFTRGIIAELLWFLAGDTNERTLRDQKVNIWKEWAAEDGDLGRVYGAQWRNWRSVRYTGSDAGHVKVVEVDQIANLIRDLKNNPNSRRHIVTAWNPGELDQMALPPCHCLFQFYTEALTPQERVDSIKGTLREADPEGDLAGFLKDVMNDGRVHDPSLIIEGVPNYLLPGMEIPRYRLSCQLYQRSQMSAIAA